jgi:hypothetical protein
MFRTAHNISCACCYRQAGTSTDEVKDLGGWMSRVIVDRYAKFAAGHLAVAASRIESDRSSGNVVELGFRYGETLKEDIA